jgi:hypothetical protein
VCVCVCVSVAVCVWSGGIGLPGIDAGPKRLCLSRDCGWNSWDLALC